MNPIILEFNITNLLTFLQNLDLGFITNDWISLAIIIVIAFLICKDRKEKIVALMPISLLVANLGFVVAKNPLIVVAIFLIGAINLVLAQGYLEPEETPQE